MRVAKVITLGLCVIVLAMGSADASVALDSRGAYHYEIAGNDGYGLEECLDGASECGQLVADAWCDAHGHGTALDYGLPGRFKSADAEISPAPETYVVDCSR